MNRQEFLAQLTSELANLPNDERAAALQYFTMYFDDAGPEHENEVIQELGSPQKLAADIKSSSGYDFSESWAPSIPAVENTTSEKKDLSENKGSNGSFSEDSATIFNTNSSTDSAQTPIPPNPTQQAASSTNSLPPGSAYGGSSASTQASSTYPSNTSNNTLKIILLIVLSPLWLSLLATIIGFLISFMAILAVPLIIGISFFFAAIGLFFGSFFLLGITFPNFIFILGLALFFLGAGLTISWCGVWILKKIIPALFRGFSSLCKAIFGKGGN